MYLQISLIIIFVKNIFQKLQEMKKLLFVFAAILTIVLSSCKSHEKCPAYSKKDMNKEVRS